jgi:predicted amidohydrolase
LNGRTYNAAVLISPEGEILLKHQKINELEIAQDLYTTGKSLRVVETPLGTIGVNICADNFSNSLALAHAQARMGCQVLLSPSSWAVDENHDNAAEPYGEIWHESYTTLAKLYDMTVVGVSNVGWLQGGPWKGRKCIGCSLAIGPGDRVLARGPYGADAESLILVSIEVLPKAATETGTAPVLASRGYEGP